jgi:hypothetical protein
MKGNRYDSIEDIQKATTSIINNIPVNEMKKFEAFVERANRCINAEGNYFE